jgi:phosphotransferase system IIA component
MNSRKQRVALFTDMRLASMARMAARLSGQLRELNQLRDRVRKAELLGQGSPPTNGKVAQPCQREAGRVRLPTHWQRRSAPLNQ